jgi:hypothetical protein
MEWKVERSPTAATKMVEAPGDVQSLHLTAGGQGEGPMEYLVAICGLKVFMPLL